MKSIHTKEIAACVFGALLGGLFVFQVINIEQSHVDPYDTDYHVHADFLIYLDDRQLDLGQTQYMTTAEQHLHNDVHLHDDNGSIVHYHEENVTFSEFLSSLNYTLTNDCFITTAGQQFCNNETETMQLYVNNNLYTDDISAYVPADEDRILLYYGTESNENITAYLDAVTDEACIYSGTCPERGIAPAESCGLTCEL